MPMTQDQKDAAGRFVGDWLGRITGRVIWCHCVSCRTPMPVRDLEAHVCGEGVSLLELLRTKRVQMKIDADKDAEFKHAMAVLKQAIPDLARVLNSKNEHAPVPLNTGQFRALAREIWKHGYAYGEASEMEREGCDD